MGYARPLDSFDPHEEAASFPATVLVVEDEVLLRTMVAEELRDQGYVALEATNADEALSILQTNTPVHIMFTDVNMPGPLDGIDLAHIVCAEFPAVDVVVTSGHLRRAELNENVSGFFPKPYDLRKLVAYLRSLFDLKSVQSFGKC
jgi:DNA-binding NtrC family response regulator